MACNCDQALGNTGLPACKALMRVTKKLIFVPYFKANGDINEETLSGLTFDQAFLDGKVQEVDPFNRWYPVNEVDNIENLRADKVVETLNSGVSIAIQDGTRTFTGFVAETGTEFADKLRSNGCVDLGVYYIDKDGNLIGNGGTDGKIRPIRVDRRSWDSGFVFPTDSTSGKVRIKYDHYSLEKDEDIRQISNGSITADILNCSGLVDALPDGAATTISTTGFTQAIKTCYGDLLSPVLVEGLLIADFVSSDTAATGQIYNVTDASDVAILTVTELPDGTYAFTYAAQTSADVLLLKVAEAAGYDSDALEAQTIPIP